jgi:hypothetical protein
MVSLKSSFQEEASVLSIQNNRLMRTLGLVAVILIAASLRLVPHAPNFSPIAAMALFGGAYLSRKSLAFFAPLAAMFLSDCVLGFHDQVVAVYASFALVTMIGFVLAGKASAQGRVKPSAWGIGLSSAAGSVVFFAITNFTVWFGSGMYERSAQGLLNCYVAALPFLQNSLVGDALFAAVMFGAWAVVEKAIPSLQEA